MITNAKDAKQDVDEFGTDYEYEPIEIYMQPGLSLFSNSGNFAFMWTLRDKTIHFKKKRSNIKSYVILPMSYG